MGCGHAVLLKERYSEQAVKEELNWTYSMCAMHPWRTGYAVRKPCGFKTRAVPRVQLGVAYSPWLVRDSPTPISCLLAATLYAMNELKKQ